MVSHGIGKGDEPTWDLLDFMAPLSTCQGLVPGHKKFYREVFVFLLNINFKFIFYFQFILLEFYLQYHSKFAKGKEFCSPLVSEGNI